MDEKLEKVIKEYWSFELPALKKRELNPFLSDPLITDIVGPRRAGKTYLMFSIIKNLPKKSTIYINFENRRLFPLKEEIDDGPYLAEDYIPRMLFSYNNVVLTELLQKSERNNN